MKIVLFLGAGFSANFGLPVMNTFHSYVDRCKRVTQSQRDFLREVSLEAQRANSYLESSPTNLEDVLSFAVMGDRLGLYEEGKERGPQIRKILERVCTDFAPVKSVEEYWNRYKAFGRFLGFEPKTDHELAIITTNYDVNAECALHYHNLMADIGFEWVPSEDGDSGQSLYGSNGIPLFKLHGSANWYHSASPDTFAVEARLVSVHTDRGGGGVLPRVCTRDFQTERDPVIVPPSFLKPDLRGPLGRVWGSAAEALGTASLLVFVGYSFPDSDIEMMYFLARSLADNGGLRGIHVVDPAAPTIVERLRRPESRFGSYFRALMQPVSARWETATLELP